MVWTFIYGLLMRNTIRKRSTHFTALRATTRGVGSKFSVLAPLSCSFASDFAKTRNCHKINVPSCADGHLRLGRILPDGRARDPRDRSPPDSAGAGKYTERAGEESCALIWIGSAPRELSVSKRLWRQRCSSRKGKSKFRTNCLSGCPRLG